MYLEHYGFEREPFNITPDSRFLFASRRHGEAMASLLYGIEHRKGFIALTGEIGSGKTTICRTLLRELDRPSIKLALVFNPQVSDLELLQTICHEYGLPSSSASKRELLESLNQFLLAQYEQGNNCVLVIDESQRLSMDALEQVRLISNLELEDTKLIQIALVGQPELDDMLHKPELEQLNQRITVRCHIDPLDEDEAADYVRHRLHVANPAKGAEFDRKAMRLVFTSTDGVPRRINVLCDRALLVGFVDGARTITEAHVRKAIEEVRGRRDRKAPSRRAVEAAESDGFDSGDVAVANGGDGNSSNGRWIALGIAACGIAIAVAVATSHRGASGAPTVQVAAAPPTPTPTATPEATPEATPVAEATAVPAPTASPSPIAPAPTQAAVVAVAPTATPTPAATEAPAPASTPAAASTAWAYDADGVLRVDRGDMAYAAAVLTWVARETGDRLPEGELATLRGMSPDAVAELRLTRGQAPLFLREAMLPATLDVLRQEGVLPALAQVDAGAEGFGPWAVVLAVDEAGAHLADPLRGATVVDAAKLEEHLAAVFVPYSDPEGITDLRPGDEGVRVQALQRLLARAGFFRGEPDGHFDERTSGALAAFRAARSLGDADGVDTSLALALLATPASTEGTP